MTNNLEYYKVFYYVVKCGSLTVAAERLSISQPAVSQSVKQLENQVGTKLFFRTAKGIKLTKEGELLFSYVERGYEQIEAGEKKLAQMLNLDLGEIKIGASDMTLKFCLLPYLELFHEKFPKIKVTVTNAPTPETLQFLQSGKIEFGVVSTPFEAKQGISMLPVREIEDIFVAGRKFTSYKNRMLDFHDLQDLPLIFLEKNTSTRSYMDHFLMEQGIEINPEFELATSDIIVQFALRNLGIGNVVRDFAKQEIESGRLFELRFNKMIPKREFCIITDSKNPLSKAAKNLLDLIKEEVEQEKGKLN